MYFLLQNLSLHYDDNQLSSGAILKNISIKINDYDCIGLVGESGAGKTELSYALARLNDFKGSKSSVEKHIFEENDIKLNLSIEKDMNYFRSNHIRYIFQEAFSYFNPVQKLKYQLGSSVHFEECIQLLNELDLKDHRKLLNSYPHQLSGGQLQRIAIARSLSSSPSLVVADEIDSALDSNHASQLFDLLMKYKTRKKFALIYLSHNLEFINSFCNRIWHIEKGQLVYDGPQSEFNSLNRVYQENKNKTVPLTQPVIQILNISKSFVYNTSWFDSVKKQLLKDISLDLFEGETVGVFGHSGIGKSTFGKIIAGIENADFGEIRMDGKEIPANSFNNKIIYLFQDAISALNPKHTVAQILKEALHQSNNATGDITHSILLSKVNLDIAILTLKANQLSGGMRQRLVLARAIALRPRLIIFDESLNALDLDLKKSLLQVLDDFQKESGVIYLHLSHDIVMLSACCHRIFALENGILIPKTSDK